MISDYKISSGLYEIFCPEQSGVDEPRPPATLSNLNVRLPSPFISVSPSINAIPPPAMPRNHSFLPSHEPLRANPHLNIRHELTTGPFSFLNPTRAHYTHSSLSSPLTDHVPTLDTTPEAPSATNSAHTPSPAPDAEKATPPTRDEQLASDVEFQWRSRDNRKGRHALVVTPAADSHDAKYITPRSTHTLRAALHGVWKMGTRFPYWDVSWLVATVFTLGSVLWCINGSFVWLPAVAPSSAFPTEVLQGGGITAFIGATVFELGSVLLMVEAVNENRAGCFGWALERALEGGRIRLRPSGEACCHHHTNRRNFVGAGVKGGKGGAAAAGSSASSVEAEAHGQADKAAWEDAREGRSWQWFPSRHELTTHYLRDIGFLACLAQMFGASVFWISGFTALPGVNNKLSQGLLDGIYWTPQVVGGMGFVVSGWVVEPSSKPTRFISLLTGTPSTLFMLETQKRWYIPALNVLGWHIGFWNLIGAIGFTLSGALGPDYLNSGAQYQAGLATFWGSWAFLIGSLIQWYECLDTHPVEEKGKDD
ncbi:hypothetical protein MMC32_000779 [Xylographa parallela]|nr:hypothetical protein [Xylographa parallela]